MSCKPLIANELLAFINHAIDYMDEVSILQICKTSFKEEEVSSAKLLLFQSLGKIEQMQSRRRDGGQKCVQDIITLLKSTDPDDVPVFVAKELHKLPPVSFDHVDVTRLLKDITTLKTNLAEVQSKLEVSNNTIEELRTEVVLLRNAIAVIGSPDACNLYACRGEKNAAISSVVPPSSTAPPAVEIASVASRSADVVNSTSIEVVTHVGTSSPKRAYAAIAAEKPAVSQTKRPAEHVKRDKQSAVIEQPKQRGPEKGECDKNGFMKVEKKKRRQPPCRNQCGTALAGPNFLLRAAAPTTQLYVSRLHYATKVEEIMEYVRAKTNWTLRVEELKSRHETNFKSFVMRVPTHLLETFLKQEFWPKGVVYRRFRGRLRDTSQRNTTPSIRVN